MSPIVIVALVVVGGILVSNLVKPSARVTGSARAGSPGTFGKTQNRLAQPSLTGQLLAAALAKLLQPQQQQQKSGGSGGGIPGGFGGGSSSGGRGAPASQPDLGSGCTYQGAPGCAGQDFGPQQPVCDLNDPTCGGTVDFTAGAPPDTLAQPSNFPASPDSTSGDFQSAANPPLDTGALDLSGFATGTTDLSGLAPDSGFLDTSGGGGDGYNATF